MSLFGAGPAVGALAVAATLCAALVAYEVVRHRDARAAIRSGRSALRPGDLAQLDVGAQLSDDAA